MELLERLFTSLLANLHLVAALLAFWVVDHLAQRHLRTLETGSHVLPGLTTWLGAGALMGARVVYLLPTLEALYRFPLGLIYINSGLSLYGALAGGVLALLAYKKLRDAPFWQTLDAYALFMPMGIAVFRLTCFLHGPCWGRATDSFLGMHFPGIAVRRYPSELYEGILALMLFAILLQISLKRPIPGLISAAFLLGYAAIRALTDLTRLRVGFWPTADPWLALGMGLIGVVVIIVSMKYVAVERKPVPNTHPVRNRR